LGAAYPPRGAERSSSRDKHRGLVGGWRSGRGRVGGRLGGAAAATRREKAPDSADQCRNERRSRPSKSVQRGLLALLGGLRRLGGLGRLCPADAELRDVGVRNAVPAVRPDGEGALAG